MWGRDWHRIGQVLRGAEHIEAADDMRWYIGNHIADYLLEDAVERDKEFDRDRFLSDCGLIEADSTTTKGKEE